MWLEHTQIVTFVAMAAALMECTAMPLEDTSWFATDVCINEPPRLGSTGLGSDTSENSMELEVARVTAALQRIRAPVEITAVDYCSRRARFSTGAC